MNTKEFLEILRNPQKLEDKQAYDIEYVINSFPYFQAARAIHLKSLKNQNSFRYNQNLKTVAAYTTDRNVLFQFITSENFLLNKKLNQSESDFIKEIEIIDENVINNLNKKAKLIEEENIDQIYNSIETTKEKEDITLEKNKNNWVIHKDLIESDINSNNNTLDTKTPDTPIEESSEKPGKIKVFVDNISDLVSVDLIETDQQKISIDTVFDEKSEEFKKNKQDTNEQSLIESLRKDVKETRYILDNSILLEKETQSKSFLFEFDQKDEIINIEEKESITQTEIVTKKPFNLLFEPLKEASKPESINQTEQVIIESDLDAELNKPLNFNEEDRYSFNEWMHLSSFKPIDRNSKPKKKKMELIDEFIEKNPRIKPIKNTDSKQVNIADNKMENHLLMTETLAQVYTQQKKYKSAIKAYEVLSLKFPEKSGFFADQIKVLEKLK